MAGFFFSVGGGRADVDTRATVYVLNAVDRKLELGTSDLYLPPECMMQLFFRSFC